MGWNIQSTKVFAYIRIVFNMSDHDMSQAEFNQLAQDLVSLRQEEKRLREAEIHVMTTLE